MKFLKPGNKYINHKQGTYVSSNTHWRILDKGVGVLSTSSVTRSWLDVKPRVFGEILRIKLKLKEIRGWILWLILWGNIIL